MDVRRGSAALLLALAVSACSGSDDKPSTLPPLTTTPSPTSAPSVPPFPATKQGAADFVRLYLQTGNRVEATGEVDLLTPLFEPGCETCQDYVATMRSRWAKGRIEGGSITPQFVETALADGSQATVTANVTVSATRIYEKDRLVKTVPAVKSGVLIFRLGRYLAGWRVRAYGVQQ
jgi:hypothetical protein